ncbi:hypothetical protein AAVH_12270 [Aphelenchoides avenae]|nr:hypothetical protein AAVH_12270 [Aphelenchus avenae]
MPLRKRTSSTTQTWEAGLRVGPEIKKGSVSKSNDNSGGLDVGVQLGITECMMPQDVADSLRRKQPPRKVKSASAGASKASAARVPIKKGKNRTTTATRKRAAKK